MIAAPQPLSFRQKIGFLRAHARSLAPWPVACGALAGGLWFWAITTIHHEKTEVRNRAFISVASEARTYADQVERNIAQIDFILRNLQFQWQKNGGVLNLEEQAYAGLVPEAAGISVTVLDESGMPVTTTNPKVNRSQRVASLDYFQFHSAKLGKELLISKPSRSLLTGRDVVLLSRRLEGDKGVFAGVIVIAVEPLFLGAFVEQTKLGKDDFVSVRRSDGAFFAVKTGSGFRSEGPIFLGNAVVAQPSGVRVVPADQYVDGKARIVAWKAAASYPVVLIVGMSEAALLEAYEPRYREIRLLAAGGSLVLLLLVAGGMRRAARRVLQAHHVSEVHDAYRIATENAKEGFYMLRALYDPSKEIVDFLIEDCNERGALYRGLSRESLIGKTLSAMFPARFKVMLAPCRQAMETGFFGGEMRVPPGASGASQWIQTRLVRTSGGLAVTLRDITESKVHQAALVHLANADSVTSLPSRHWLMNHLPLAVASARAKGRILAVLFVDLDDFKNVNDTLGHATGDQLLKAAALRLKGVIRPRDRIARLGGDEFTIIVEAAQSREEVAAVAERVIETLRTPFVLGDGTGQLFVHASVGISMFPQDGADGETLLKHADIAMYAAKGSAKGTSCFFEPSMERRLVTRLNREAELKLAIERHELVLHYQPRVRSDTGELTSMEALVRWIHPVLGLIPPNEFIPMAERTGLIVPLGAEVIRMACAQLALWKEQGLAVVPVSVNVSARQIDTGTVSTLLAAALQANGLDPSLLEVEITESATVTKAGLAATELATIQKLGIKLYVDDFGTGYSCLAQLRELQMDGLKIDRAFTTQLLNGRADAALFEAIVWMAHALEMRVVVEGVETAEQLAALQALACEEVQGYFISKAVPAANAAHFLQKRFLFPEVLLES